MALLRLIPVGQAYATEDNALEAIESLKAADFDEEDISIVTPSMIEPANPWMLTKGEKDGMDSTEMLAEVIIGVHEASTVPDSHALIYADNIQEGRSVVLVTAPFGQAARASDILKNDKAIDIGELPMLDDYHYWIQPAPLSALVGMPVLSQGRTWMESTFGGTTDSNYFPTKGWFGGLLSNNPAPLSSRLGWDLLKDDNPAPLSSKFGWKVLREDDPTPLSDKIGYSPLSESRPASKRSSFGLPLLSHNPTPLSSMFGWKVLKHDDD